MVLWFAYPELLFISVPLAVGAFIYRVFWYRYPVYRYPMTGVLIHNRFVKKISKNQWLLAIRTVGMFLLSFLVARPQWVDTRSSIDVNGIDIVIALDVSGSMQIFDDLKDRRSRIDVARAEAIRFIEKRHNDPIGVVLFAKDALSRTPITLDKHFLKEIVGSLRIGLIDPNETWLGTGLATSVNRLRMSKSKSKIIILLTDGAPTPHEKISPDQAVDLAKQFGIRVYTIGIGNNSGGYFSHPLMGLQTAGVSLNEQLLEKIAKDTGGRFFRASNPKEMREVYDTIDELEKTKYETNLFHHYYEAFFAFMWILMLMIGLEMVLRLWIFRGI